MRRPAVCWSLKMCTEGGKDGKKKKLSHRCVFVASLLPHDRFACLLCLIFLITLASGASVLSKRIALTVVTKTYRS